MALSCEALAKEMSAKEKRNEEETPQLRGADDLERSEGAHCVISLAHQRVRSTKVMISLQDRWEQFSSARLFSP